MNTTATDAAPVHIGLLVPEMPRIISPPDPEPEPETIAAATPITWRSFIEHVRTFRKPMMVSPSAMFDQYPAMVQEGLSVGEMVMRVRHQMLEDLDQGTAQFVGEVAEIGELLMDCGIEMFRDSGERRAKLIDECGDVLHTATWAIDAWCRNPKPIQDGANDDGQSVDELWGRQYPGGNPLLGLESTEIMEYGEDDPVRRIRAMFALGETEFSEDPVPYITCAILEMSVYAGLTVNSYKKHRFQHSQQNVKAQIARIARVIAITNALLVMANSSIAEAMQANLDKLDRRYPGGYRPGQGGGIRTEG